MPNISSITKRFIHLPKFRPNQDERNAFHRTISCSLFNITCYIFSRQAQKAIYCVTNRSKLQFITLLITQISHQMTLRLIGLVLFTLSLNYSVLAQIANPTGKLERTQPDDIWPRTMSGSQFNEFWNYQIYLNDGITLHIVFSVNNFGSFRAPVSGVRVTAFGLSDNTYNLSREYNLNWLVLDKETYTFRNRAERDLYFTGRLPDAHRLFIDTRKDGIDYLIDLEFTDIQPGHRWGDGLYTINSEAVGIVTHIPYARVRGNVEINGHGGKVEGTAYMDQTWQTQSMTRLVHSGYRIVYHGGPENWSIINFMLPSDRDDRRTIGHRIHRDDSGVHLTGIRRIIDKTRSRAFGKQLAQNLTLELEDSKTMNINRSRDHESYSILSELPWIARRAARTFFGGEIIDFRGEAYCRIEGELPKTAHFNYFIID